MRRCVLASLVAATFLGATASPSHAGRAWIDDPTGRAVLQVLFREQPTYTDLAETQAALTRTAAILCDATEGQVRIAQIHLLSSPASKDLAALWLHDMDAASGGPYDATGADLGSLGAHMDVFRSGRLRPDRLAHLLGHHAFGLGDQYDDQRRRGGACGVGPGFDPGRLDEKNHSIMQGSGGMRCAEGPLLGQDCLRDDECAGSTCRPLLASEWSTPQNHDLLRGDGGTCPKPSPVSRVRLGGLLPSRAEPMLAFDGRDFLAARATSVWHDEMEVLGPAGTLPGVKLHFYISHTDRLNWQLTIAADAAEFGGPKGGFRVLKSWALLFNPDFSLAATHPEQMRFELPTSGGKGPLEVAIDIGSRNPGSARGAGQGYDGLQMVTAGQPAVRTQVDGIVGCSAEWCASSWNEASGRWELTEQSLLHRGASDWQTITTNLPFLALPSGGIATEAPAVCQAAPKFLTDVMGADQVVLVIDTSRSTGLRADGKPGEVCVNGIDDDVDGATDESDCADSRLEYERVAARAFIALAAGRNLEVGLVAMHTDAEVVSEVQEVAGGRRAVLGAVLGALSSEGDSAIGTALERAQSALQAVERVARSRAIVLMTDGARNVGVEPGQEARRLDPLLYRVFTVGIGRAANGLALSAMAARGGGVAFETARAGGTPAILAELASRHLGTTPVLARTPFDIAAPDPTAKAPGAISASREFEIPVEEKARELVVFLGTRNDRIDDWRLFFELQAPDGERIDDTSPQVHVERGFVVARISDPRRGRWRLRVLPGGHGVQRSEALAFVLQPNVDFFADAEPRLASATRSVRLSARPSYASDIDGDVSIDGVVRRPDGTQVPVRLGRDPITRAWGADFADFAGRGLYEVRLTVRVGEASRPALGEPIFPGPERALLRVVPFERTATASFFVADGPLPTCSVEDCDDDGLADRLEVGCPDGNEDPDRDGMPNRFDADSDNDEILDGEESVADLDRNGIPDFCEAEATPDSLSVVIAAAEAALSTACGPDVVLSRDRLRASLSALRRIVQVVRTSDRPTAFPREDLVKSLEKAIELKREAAVIGDVLPEFCSKYQARLQEALEIERELRVKVDPYLSKSAP